MYYPLSCTVCFENVEQIKIRDSGNIANKLASVVRQDCYIFANISILYQMLLPVYANQVIYV